MSLISSPSKSVFPDVLPTDLIGIVCEYAVPTNLRGAKYQKDPFVQIINDVCKTLWRQEFPESDIEQNRVRYPIIQTWIEHNGYPTIKTIRYLRKLFKHFSKDCPGLRIHPAYFRHFEYGHDRKMCLLTYPIAATEFSNAGWQAPSRDSEPEEIKKWLVDNGFSYERTCTVESLCKYTSRVQITTPGEPVSTQNVL